MHDDVAGRHGWEQASGNAVHTLMDILGHYGEIGIFVLVLLVQLGLPLPVLPVFLLL